LRVTCGLTACTPGLAPDPALGNEYGRTSIYLFGIALIGRRGLRSVQRVGKSSEPATQMRTFYHYQFLEWKDKRIPTPSEIVNVLQFVDDVNDQWRSTNYAGPIIVHCRLMPACRVSARFRNLRCPSYLSPFSPATESGEH